MNGSLSGRLFPALVIVVVAAAVVAGLFLIGSPAEERARRVDANRVDALRQIAGVVDLYMSRHGRLPDSLVALVREPGVSLETMDPKTGEPYGFRVLSDSTYELCATFEMPSAEGSGRIGEDWWFHETGPTCYPLKASTTSR